MKLLFDANLSPKLGGRLAELFSDSVHVFATGLARFTPDEIIWEYAGANGFTIVTADSDFLDLARSRGAPPKVVLIENCNYRTPRIEEVLRRHAIAIAELNTPREQSCLSEAQSESRPSKLVGITALWRLRGQWIDPTIILRWMDAGHPTRPTFSAVSTTATCRQWTMQGP